MKRGFGRSRAGSFLWRLRGAESSDGDSNSADDAPSQPHSARAAVWQSQPEFRTSNLPRPREKPELKRRGSLGAWLLRLRVSRGKSDEEERKYTGTTSDEDDHSYAEDDNHDSGRVNSRTYRKRKRTGRRRAKRVSADDYESADEMAHSTSRARGPRGGRGEDKEDEEETTSLSSEEDSTEECVAVDSDEDSDESSGSSETDSTEDEEAVDNLRRQERVQERRQREKRKAEEKKRLRRVEKRKLQKLANQRKREGLGELQRQLQKRREEKEIRRQEEKHWKELRRIEKFLDKARQKEEKKARKTQLQEQRQREARARQEQLRYILLARLGRPSSDEAAARGADAGAATVHQEQLRAVGHEAAAPSGTEQTADEAAGQPVGHERAVEATAERKTQVEAAPSIVGLPSAVNGSRPAKEVVTIAVTEPCRPPSRGDETEEAEDEESEDTSVKRATTNRGRVTDIPALRLGACPPKRSPKTQASSAQLIRGLIGFDQLADALFELNREVEELRNLTS